MNYCQHCGAQDWEYLESGGCGGRGETKGCRKCGTVFMQTSGGLISSPGGETWKPLSYTLDEYHQRQTAKH